MLALVALSIAAAATADDSDGTASVQRFQRLDINELGLSDGKIAAFTPASISDKQVSVMLKLSGAPVAARGNLNASQKAAARAELKAAQDAMKKDVERAGATIVGQTQDAYNGILVHAKQRDLTTLSSIRGVVAVESVGRYAVPDNVNGVPLIGAPAAWGSAAGLTGQGVKVGIIDTGLDYTHADFGGAGTEAAYNTAHAASTTAPAAGSYDPAKFLGGQDFVGDDYDANVDGSVPVPDPNPLDCNGHGTHVAGTTAGYGVTASGSTYAGPYNASTVSGNSWLVGPGVAPKAGIRSYRVFGCEGSTDVVILAINQAVADGVDVINMSLGSPFGTSDQGDAELTAVNNAVQAGVTVIASAGNSGGSAYIVGAPSSANRALSVAASDGSVPTYPGGEFNFTAGTPPAPVKAINANGASFTTLTAPVKVLRNADGSVSLGCDPAEYAAAANAIAVVQRGTCARVARAVFGQKAGAKAVVMINNSTSLPPFEGKITSNPDTGEQYTVTIPFFGVKGLATSGADALALIAKDGQTVTITATTVPNTTYKATASFSSGGPRNGDSAAKPEITAPGVSVSSALVGGGTASTILSGTSMAAPMTAGSAALVKQAHPGWNGDEIKAVLVNTADPAGVANFSRRLNGTGFLRVDRATVADVIMTTADHLDSLSFGYQQSATAAPVVVTKSFDITNKGTTARTYSLASSSGLVTLSASSVTVNPGQTVSVSGTLTLTAALLATLPSASPGFGAVTTASGTITATPSDGSTTLRMNWLTVPRGLSNITASAPAPFVKQANNNIYTSSTTVANGGIHAGGADFYAWGIKDAKDLAGNWGQDIRDAGVQSFSDGTIVFAVNGWNASSTQATQEYDVAIDLQNDKKADYFVVAVDFGAVTTGTFDGRVAAFLFDAKSGGLASSNVFVADAPMNGSTALIPVAAEDLGLHSSNSSFNYWVNGFSVVGGPADTTAAAAYDVAKPGVSTGMFESLNPGQSKSVPLAADYDKLQSAPALGWLVVNTDDSGGPASAEEIALGALK
jgi:subtilisin family serine protease